MLSSIIEDLEKVEQEEMTAVKRAKTAKQKVIQKPESLDQAHQRILGLKLKEDEIKIVNLVFSKLLDGTLTREKAGKISKKEVFELYRIYNESERQKKIEYVISSRPENYLIVQDYDALTMVDNMLNDEPETGWDTETQGLDIFNHMIVGYSAYLPKNDIAFYVPFGHTTGQQQVSKDAALAVAKNYLEKKTNRTIFHNYKFDGHMFANHGIQVANPYWDTQVAAKLLNEHESHRLKALHAKYVLKKPDNAVQFEDLFPDHTIYDKDVILSGIYACGDPHKTYQVYQFQKPFIETRDNLITVWSMIEQELLNVDLDMERTGFCIDFERIDMLLKKHKPELEQAERDLIAAFNINSDFIKRMSAALGKQHTEFKFTSPAQLSYLIYDEIGIPADFPRKFKDKDRSTGSKVIKALAKENEAFKRLLVHRQLSKLVTTYLEKIPKAIEPKTGKLHARFNNMSVEDEDNDNNGTNTGRYSSSTYVAGKHSATGDVAKGTNLQNIPSKGLGKEVRKCFIPDEDWIFVASDLSQIEPRIIAHILSTQYNDNSMRDTYIAGKDIYTSNAVSVFELEEKYCIDGALDPTGTYEPRKLMKQGVLSFLYGSSPRSFARDMNVPEEVAEKFFESMIQKFPGLVQWRKDIIAKLMNRGHIAYAETLFGRKRRFPDYRTNKTELLKLEKIPYKKLTDEQKKRRSELWFKCAKDERAAANMEVQGTAADVLKQIMVAMYKQLIKPEGNKLNASIHDELLMSFPKKRLTRELIAQINEIMTKTVTLCLPLKCDTVIMPRWEESYKPEEWDFENCKPLEVIS